MNSVVIDLNTLASKIDLSHEKRNDFIIKKGDVIYFIPAQDRNHYILYPTSMHTQKTKKIVAHVCKVNIRCFYEDYHNSLDLYDMEILYPGKEFLNIVKFDTPNTVFWLSFDHRDSQWEIPLLQENSAVINFEQFFVYNGYATLRKMYDKGWNILDYSAVHCMFLEREIHLPYQYHEREVNLLKSLLRSQPKEFDVCMIANGTPHRIAIWEELKKRGVKVNHVTGWLLPRDIEIAKCRLLLNVHVDTEQVGYVIYEHLRCDRWMFAELPIISESSKLDDEPEELGVVTPHGGKGITFVPYEKIIETVIETLAKLKQDENCDDDNNEEEKRIEMNSLISVRNEKFQKVLKKFDII